MIGRSSKEECVGSHHYRIFREKFVIFLLWLISKKDMYGYEIIKELKNEPHFGSFTASKLYPVLKELLRRGLVSQKRQKQGKMVRKIYSLTPEGGIYIKEAKEKIWKSPLIHEFLKEMMK